MESVTSSNNNFLCTRPNILRSTCHVAGMPLADAIMEIDAACTKLGEYSIVEPSCAMSKQCLNVHLKQSALFSLQRNLTELGVIRHVFQQRCYVYLNVHGGHASLLLRILTMLHHRLRHQLWLCGLQGLIRRPSIRRQFCEPTSKSRLLHHSFND